VSSPSDEKSESVEPVCFMINVHSGASPLTIEGLNGPEFKGLTVFATRSREEGRDRHRVHVGYFPSAQAAAPILALVRLRYPAAWVLPCPAPVTRMKPAAKAPAREEVPALPPPLVVSPDLFSELTPALELFSAKPVVPPMPVQAAPAARVEAGAPPAAPSAALNEPFELFDAPFYKLELMPDPLPASAPAEARGAKSPAAQAPPARAQAAEGDLAFVETITLSESQVLQVLEDGASVHGESASEHAVQVMWSETPIDIRLVPKSPMFTEYTLYPFRGVYRGHRGYGLRLGFFKEQYAAEQVAAFLRSDYEQSVIVKVSAKERLDATPPAVIPVAAPRGAVKSVGGKVRAAVPAPPPVREASTRILASLGGALPSRKEAAVKPQSWFKGLVRRLG
jgi:hypothetical protein